MTVKLAMNAERAAENAYRIARLRREAAAHVNPPRVTTRPGSLARHPAQDPNPAGAAERREPRRH